MSHRSSVSAIIVSLSLLSFSASSYASFEDCQPPANRYSAVECTADSDVFVAYDKDYHPQALLNKQGQVRANLTNYEDVGTWFLSEGYMPVLKNGKVGYIDIQGKLVVPALYDSLIDPENKYDENWASNVNNGRIVVAKNGRYGVIDTANQIILPFTNSYSTIDGFSEGVATVQSAKTGKWGLISSNGKEIVTPQYDSFDGSLGGNYGFSEGLIGVRKNNKWGYITKTGKLAVPLVYDEIRPFSEQLAGVRKGKLWGFINGANQIIIPLKYSDDNISRLGVNYLGATYFIFNQGNAEVADKADGTTVCVNKAANVVPCQK